eukprot:13939183-Heterocapsa_arctica.AAC.1
MADSERGVEGDDDDAGEESGLGGGSQSPARSLPEEDGERVEPSEDAEEEDEAVEPAGQVAPAEGL